MSARNPLSDRECLVFLGKYCDEADGMLTTAADAAKELDHPMLYAGILESIAWLRAMNDNISEARRNFHEALLMYKKANAANAAAGVLLNAAEAEFFAGNVDSAVKLAGEALGSFRSQNDEYSVTNVLGNLSAYSIAAAEWDEAELYAREALSLAQQLNLEIHAAWALQHIACVVALATAAGTSREDYERAAQILGFVTARYTSLAIENSPSEKREHIRILSHLGDVLGSNDLARLMSVGQTLTSRRQLPPRSHRFSRLNRCPTMHSPLRKAFAKSGDLVYCSGMFPNIEPYERGLLAVGESQEIYWECIGKSKWPARSSTYTVGPVPAAAHGIVVSSIRISTESSSWISAAARAAVRWSRARRTSRRTPRSISSSTSSFYAAISTWIAGRSPAHLGVRRWRSPTHKRIPAA